MLNTKVLRGLARFTLASSMVLVGQHFASAQQQTFWVNSATDNPNIRSSDRDGFITLREAILAATSQRPFGDAPAGARTNTIRLERLKSSLSKNTVRIALNSPIDVYSSKQLNINIWGGNNGKNIVIDGGEKHQLFQVGGEVALSLHWVDLTNGRGTNGGAICVNDISSLSFHLGEITKCFADNNGGAIYFNSDRVFATSNASFLDNQAGGSGGAICAFDGDVDLDHVTVARNEADGYGGGLYLRNAWFNRHFIQESTFVFNSAYSTGAFPQGGGIAETARSTGRILLEGTLIASNDAPVNGFQWNNDVGASFSTGSAANLIGSGWGFSGLVDGSRRNQVGSVFSPIAPMLSSLGYHGSGPSRNYIPDPSSPAINAGQPRAMTVPGFQPSDQRSLPRYVGGFADVGSVERQQFPN